MFYVLDGSQMFTCYSDLLKAVILVSEKAANIARAIRQEEHLLSLLVREKKDGEKNPRFVHDFKTLADVLVQEVVKHDLGLEVRCIKAIHQNLKLFHFFILCKIYF